MAVRVPAAAALALAIAACGDAPEPPVCAMSPHPRSIAFSQCGPSLDFTPINRYQGEIASVQDREDAVALINGTCTGTLIAAAAGPVVLTAGHCVVLGEQVLVAFNVEADPDGDTLATDGVVIEQAGEPDYALIALDRLPQVVPTLLTTRPTERLAVIQHPRGAPKVIAEGRLAGACDGVIYYSDLDTLVGSSGAGVLNHDGYLVGVHSDGDCDASGGGTNHGSTAEVIVAASAHLQDADIADR
jgi:hypothetical protein